METFAGWGWKFVRAPKFILWSYSNTVLTRGHINLHTFFFLSSHFITLLWSEYLVNAHEVFLFKCSSFQVFLALTLINHLGDVKHKIEFLLFSFSENRSLLPWLTVKFQTCLKKNPVLCYLTRRCYVLHHLICKNAHSKTEGGRRKTFNPFSIETFQYVTYAHHHASSKL